MGQLNSEDRIRLGRTVKFEMIIVWNAKIVKIVGTLCLLLDCVEFVHKKGTLL